MNKSWWVKQTKNQNVLFVELLCMYVSWFNVIYVSKQSKWFMND